MSKAAEGKARAEILREMLETIELQRPEDPVVFGQWMNVLNQGADFEGVYNSLTHSARYRSLERETLGSGAASYAVFAHEFEALRAESKHPLKLDADSARPLPDQSDRHRAIFGSAPVPTLKNLEPFRSASVFTQKRVLGEAALGRVRELSKDRDALARWYGKFVVRMGMHGVDFGLKTRNDLDEAFHVNWARNAPLDRIQWEVLNRYHRLLNRPFLESLQAKKTLKPRKES